MTETADKNSSPSAAPRLKAVLGVILLSIIVSVITVWVTTVYLFPRELKPVVLDHKEEVVLTAKVKDLKLELRTAPPARQALPKEKKVFPAEAPLEPQKYSEAGAPREVTFTEREINALIATNTDLASKLAVDLSPDLVSARLVLPLDPEMPIFGGKILRLSAGVELHYLKGRPVVILKGVSLWGVPLPNAWLGDLKNVDLVHEFGDEGFWHAFAAGVENIAVGDGTLTLKLKK